MKTWWSLSEDMQLIRLYPHLETVEVARLIGRDIRSVYNRARKLQLRKSSVLLRSVNRTNSLSRRELIG